MDSKQAVTVQMEEPMTNTLAGFLLIKKKKWLKGDQKYWFVLDSEVLTYYKHSHRERTQSLVGTVELKDVEDIRLSYQHRNTLVIIIPGKEHLQLKVVEKGTLHNWYGALREAMMRSRVSKIQPVGKLPVKRRVTKRSTTQTGEDLSSFQALRDRRKSRSATNLLDMARDTPIELLTRCPSTTSIYTLASVSGSNGSVGGISRAKLPVSGLTKDLYVRNESKMNETVDVILSEDLEQFRDVPDGQDALEDELDSGGLSTEGEVNLREVEEDKESYTARNVHFNSVENIKLIHYNSLKVKHDGEARGKKKFSWRTIKKMKKKFRSHKEEETEKSYQKSQEEEPSASLWAAALEYAEQTAGKEEGPAAGVRRRDSISDISSELREKVQRQSMRWRSKAMSKGVDYRSSKVEISGPIINNEQLSSALECQEDIELNTALDMKFREAVDQLHSQRIIEEESTSESRAPSLPAKSVGFQIKQLEKLISGDLNPGKDISEDDLFRRLGALQVVLAIESSNALGSKEPIYDIPRSLTSDGTPGRVTSSTNFPETISVRSSLCSDDSGGLAYRRSWTLV